MQTSLFDDPSRAEAAAVLAALPELDADALAAVSVGEWLDRVEHEAVRQLAAALILLSTFSGDRHQSMGAVAAQLRQGQAGVLYLDGGWQSMVNGLERVAREAGAEIRTGTPVTAVEHARRVEGVRLADGSFVAAGAVVLAVTPDAAARLAGAGAAPERWAERLSPVRLASLDLGLRRLPCPDTRFALGMEEPLYFSVHSPDARLAPEGCVLLHAARYLRAGEEPGSEQEAELERLVDELQPGWREEVVERRFLRHVTVAGALPTAGMGGTAGRPGPAVPGIDGLYVAGDWVGPESLLSDASAASAERAVNMILARPAAAPVHAHAFAGSV
jgi:phytoene dehydrogenase-like protein